LELKKRNSNNRTTKEFMLDKLIWVLLTPIFKPFKSIYDLISPPYKQRIYLYNGNKKCYCGSNENYSKCCLPTNIEKGQIAYMIVKIYTKTKRKETEIKIVKSDSSFIKSFKKGDINPLNKRGFTDTGNYSY
jgi:hypothetical protein